MAATSLTIKKKRMFYPGEDNVITKMKIRYRSTYPKRDYIYFLKRVKIVGIKMTYFCLKRYQTTFAYL